MMNFVLKIYPFLLVQTYQDCVSQQRPNSKNVQPTAMKESSFAQK